VAFWIFFAMLIAISFERADSSGGSSRLLFKRHEGIRGDSERKHVDEEKNPKTKAQILALRGPPGEDIAQPFCQVTFT
jgi:hypothetical protein